MGNKNSGNNFPHSRHDNKSSMYNNSGNFEHNRRLAENRKLFQKDEDPAAQNDTLNTQYDDLNSGKHENYGGNGYYGSNYGSINTRGGRDYEQNAGYRESYNRLTTGEWPETQRGNESRQKAEGPHRGKGPKGYNRSDFRIREDINDLLFEDAYVDASDIEIEVKNGEVTLAGSVADKHMKRRVEDLIENISGVKHCENRLRAKITGGPTVNIKNSGN